MKKISFIKTSKVLLLCSLMALVFVGCENDDDGSDDIGNWVEESSFNGNSRYDAVTFTIGDKGYLFGGYDGDDYYNDIWTYDLITDSWSQLAFTEDADFVRTSTFPGVARRAAVGFSLNGKGYVGTGYDGDDELNDFYEFDPATNTWTQIASLPTSPRYGAVGFSINGKGYVGTGYDGSQQKDFYSYDPTTNTWEEVIGFGGEKRQDASVFVINDVAYIGTGLDNGALTDDFYSFDGTTWTELADMEDEDESAIGLYDGVGFTIDGKGYFATGISTGISNTVWEYTPATDSWEQTETTFQGNARQGASAFTFSDADRGFALMGRSGTFNFDDVWEFKPEEEENEDD